MVPGLGLQFQCVRTWRKYVPWGTQWLSASNNGATGRAGDERGQPGSAGAHGESRGGPVGERGTEPAPAGNVGPARLCAELCVLVTFVCCEDDYFKTRKTKARTFAARFGAGATWMHDAAEEEKYK